MQKSQNQEFASIQFLSENSTQIFTVVLQSSFRKYNEYRPSRIVRSKELLFFTKNYA